MMRFAKFVFLLIMTSACQSLSKANAGGASRDGPSAHDLVEKEKRRIHELQAQVKEMQQRVSYPILILECKLT